MLLTRWKQLVPPVVSFYSRLLFQPFVAPLPTFEKCCCHQVKDEMIFLMKRSNKNLTSWTQSVHCVSIFPSLNRINPFGSSLFTFTFLGLGTVVQWIAEQLCPSSLDKFSCQLNSLRPLMQVFSFPSVGICTTHQNTGSSYCNNIKY